MSDFPHASPDQILSGSAGRQHVIWSIDYDHLDPWRTVDQPQLEDLARRAVERAGLHDVLAGFELDLVKTAHSSRATLRLLLRPGTAVDDLAPYKRLHAVWPHERIAMPSLDVQTDPVGPQEPAPAGAPASLLRRLFSVDAEGAVHVATGRLRPEESAALAAWAREVRPGTTQAPERVLLALLASSTHPRAPAGRASQQALRRLELFSPFWGAALDALGQRFSQSHGEGVQFVYNGHATHAMASLLPTLRAFSLDSITAWVGKHSGSAEGRELLRLQKPKKLFEPFVRVTEITEYGGGNQRLSDRWASTENDEQRFQEFMEHAVRSPHSSWRGSVLVVDKSGPWLETLRGALPDEVRDGTVRAILHNRDDLASLAAVRQQVWGVDLASSLVKKLEARILGEQYALIGAREVREAFAARLGDTPVYIKGFGLLGEQVGRALSRLGMPRDRIVVIDKDPAVLARAKKLGFATRPAGHVEAPRQKQAVIFVATPGAGIEPKNAHDLAEHLLVVPLTSGGKGVAMAELTSAAASSTAVRRQRNSVRRAVRDWDLVLEQPGTTTRLRVLTDGQPPNLAEDMWPERFQVTAMGVSASTLQAAELKGPGVAALDPRLDRQLVRLAYKHGLWKVRPLDARDGDDPAALRRDLDAFTPSR